MILICWEFKNFGRLYFNQELIKVIGPSEFGSK